MSVLGALKRRDCPVCGASADVAEDFMAGTLDETRITKDSFASRKQPEFMSYRLVRCRTCSTVFAPEAPEGAALAEAYHLADYGSADEARFAAATYGDALSPYLEHLAHRGTAIEIGTGTGVFLSYLQRFGFSDPVGIEPSRAAIQAAAPEVKPLIREGIFTGTEYPPNSVSLVCCFQTLEHVPEPRSLVAKAYQMLEPGGLLALVTHDYDARINRFLGRRSPIIDIEHVQVFNPASLRHLVTSAGFELRDLMPFRNRYPMRYWVSLLPLPSGLKNAAIASLLALRLAKLPIRLNVGNLLTVAQKPA